MPFQVVPLSSSSVIFLLARTTGAKMTLSACLNYQCKDTKDKVLAEIRSHQLGQLASPHGPQHELRSLPILTQKEKKHHPKEVKFLGRSYPCCQYFHSPLKL